MHSKEWDKLPEVEDSRVRSKMTFRAGIVLKFHSSLVAFLEVLKTLLDGITHGLIEDGHGVEIILWKFEVAVE